MHCSCVQHLIAYGKQGPGLEVAVSCMVPQWQLTVGLYLEVITQLLSAHVSSPWLTTALSFALSSCRHSIFSYRPVYEAQMSVTAQSEY